MWVARNFERINGRFTPEKKLAAEYFGRNGATQRLGRASMLRGLSAGQYSRLKRRNSEIARGPYLPLIIEACREMTRLADEAVSIVSPSTDDLRGTLRVAASVEYSAVVLAPVLARMRDTHPNLRIEMMSGDRLIDLVAEGVDIAIRVGELTDSNYRAVRIFAPICKEINMKEMTCVEVNSILEKLSMVSLSLKFPKP